MPQTPGTRLGPYEILAPLGAGGMGEVYRARDTRLGREVAVKVLRGGMAADPESRARFDREARAIAALNHPRICTLHDLGRDGDTDYLVLELLDGQTLEARLAKGRLAPAEVLEFGAQIAEALAPAHRAGFAHRDLKPGNVMLTRSGVKLLDFGLARRLPPTSASRLNISALPTQSVALTADGQILGTIQYMSPEQLQGREADARSDLWALGAILYEMATGRRAFEADNQASLISAILNDEPRPIHEQAPLAPGGLQRLVDACLAKDAELRWQSAGDLARELRWLAGGGGATSGAGGVAPIAAASLLARLKPPLLGAGVALALATGVLAVQGRAPWLDLRRPRLVRSSVSFPPVSDIHSGGFAIAPDGSALAVASADSTGTWKLYVRRLDSPEVRALTDKEGAYMPFWSADSREIAFATGEGKLARVKVTGGPVQVVCDAPNFSGGAWGKSGWIVFAQGSGPLMRVRAEGGSPGPVTASDSARVGEEKEQPAFLPDGEHFLYAAIRGVASPIVIRVGSVRGGRDHELMTAGSVPRCSPDGWLTFIRDRTLFAQRVEPNGARLQGEAIALPEVPTRTTAFGLTTPGALLGEHVMAYIPANRRPTVLRWYERSGIPGPVIATLPVPFLGVYPSPDGKLATGVFAEGLETNIWLINLSSGDASRLTDVEHLSRGPIWTSDSRHILYQYIAADGGTIRRMDVGDPASSETLVSIPQQTTLNMTDALENGRALLTQIGWSGPVYSASSDSGYRLQTYLPAAAKPEFALFARGGKWVVFSSHIGGSMALYADTYPVRSRTIRLTREPVADSSFPFWVIGDELIYVAADGVTLRSTGLQFTANDVVAGAPRTLFTLPPELLGICPSADGRRFLAATPGASPQAPSLTLVQNWELEIGKK
ncbi:MAG: protein kinase [Candidatus Eisenbacteria bacterium]